MTLVDYEESEVDVLHQNGCKIGNVPAAIELEPSQNEICIISRL